MTTQSQPQEINQRELYRLPWNLADNIISWLEPTKKCNIYCEGCYSANNPGSHKTLEEVAGDLDVFLRLRRTDTISIAGGDPLTHPDVVKIVRMVADRGIKPILNTNGFAMTPQLLKELKAAGLKGLTFHVDSGQRRPGWTGKSEKELNQLRQVFADMVAAEGGLSCAFNSTIYEHTMSDIPEILSWAQANMDKVHIVVFIAFRSAILDGSVKYYVGGTEVNMGQLVYGKERQQRSDISSRELMSVIRQCSPNTDPCAFLNGTEQADAMKWLMTLRMGTPNAIWGSAGPKFMELAQISHHLRYGKYMGYVSPKVHRRAKWMFPLGLIDQGVRRTAWNYLKYAWLHPWAFFQPVHMQSIMIIQPTDLLADGRDSMCDGCPDMTVHNGELVWSCRLEERMKFGRFVKMVKNTEAPIPAVSNGDRKKAVVESGKSSARR